MSRAILTKKNAGKPQIAVYEILGMLHSWLLFVGLYGFIAAAMGLTGKKFFLCNGASLLLLIPLAVSWYLIRQKGAMAWYGGAAVVLSAVLCFLNYQFGQSLKPQIGGILLAAVTGAGCVNIWIVRLKAHIDRTREIRVLSVEHAGEIAELEQQWEKKNLLNSPSVTHWGWFTVLYVIGTLTGYRSFYRLMFGVLLVDVFVLILYWYFHEYDSYLWRNRKTANLPVKMMQSVHRGILAVLLAALVIGVLPSVMYGKEPLEAFFRNFAVIQGTSLAGNDQEYEEQSPFYEVFSEPDLTPVKKLPEWVKDGIDVCGLILMAAVLIWAAMAVMRAIAQMNRDFGSEGHDEVVYLEDPGRDVVEILEGGRRKKESFLSPGAQIRRQWKKQVKSASPRGWETPEELEKEAGWKGSIPEKILHELYEKARYSKNGAGREDLERMKKRNP